MDAQVPAFRHRHADGRFPCGAEHMSKIARVTIISLVSSALAAGETSLPDGPGKEIVQASCVQCHDLNRVTDTGHTREDWRTVLDTMIAGGAKVPKDKIPVVAAYLAKYFPERRTPGKDTRR